MFVGELKAAKMDPDSNVLICNTGLDEKADRYVLEVHFSDRILRLGSMKEMSRCTAIVRDEALKGLKQWEASICRHHAYYTRGMVAHTLHDTEWSAGANPYISSPPAPSEPYQSVSPLEEEERQYQAARLRKSAPEREEQYQRASFHENVPGNRESAEGDRGLSLGIFNDDSESEDGEDSGRSSVAAYVPAPSPVPSRPRNSSAAQLMAQSGLMY